MHVFTADKCNCRSILGAELSESVRRWILEQEQGFLCYIPQGCYHSFSVGQFVDDCYGGLRPQDFLSMFNLAAGI